MKIDLNGVLYEYEAAGEGEPLLLLHGFTGSMDTWRPFLASWSREYQVIMVDLLGHGKTESPASTKRFRIEQAACDLVSLLERLEIEKVHVLGYSMGGRLALSFACLYPERVNSLLLENCTAGLVSEEERAARVQQDQALASFIEQKGIPAFIEKWENISLFASQKQLPDETQEATRKQRLQNSPVGLANSLRGMGTGRQPSWWNELHELTMPVLLISGEYDEKFFRILSRMKELIPRADLVQISGAGHAIHVEQPEKFDTIVRGFLQNLIYME
ncbi:2-succinyl-6-hydroxy-2,4-cyclohexadiene-1-carboxylate synthase [Ectobacillus panaciterrae]|uniref:2-succinyl-6-hydroxy-2, 4-cyclohexadiene-1-carboxylate synthase n=1 Tax=Ectobacillus panaciterrae TaxID=363872 RepID=UPI000421D622|nr:2-succinyl-6-hydroxy-2,4-cyclohexadiene-1-carboxylate synthase [Ectobacillus panaciterrae]